MVVGPFPVEPTRVPWGRVSVVLACIFGDALNMMLVFPFLPFLVRDLVVIEAAHESSVAFYAGLLAGAYKLGQFAMAPAFGLASDHFGRRPTMLVAMALGPVLLLAFALAPSFSWAFAFRLLQGAVAGGVTVGKVYLADITDETNEARVFSCVGLGMGMGVVAGPTVGGLLARPTVQYPWVPEFDPSRTATGRLFAAFPYLLPCLVSVAFSAVNMVGAYALLLETRQPAGSAPPSSRRSTLDEPLLLEPTADSLAGDQRMKGLNNALGSDGRVTFGASAILDSMSIHSGGVPLIDVDESSCPSAEDAEDAHDRRAREAAVPDAPPPRPRAVDGDGPTRSPSLRPQRHLEVPTLVLVRSLRGRHSEHPSRRAWATFWLLQAVQVLFTVTGNGLAEVLPVRMSAPASAGGYELPANAIGATQAVGGFTILAVVVCVYFRLVSALGAVRSLHIGLFANVLVFAAPLCVDAWQLSARTPPRPIAVAAAFAGTFALRAFSLNTANSCSVLLSKASLPCRMMALALALNQSASSLGNAIGPILSGYVYGLALERGEGPEHVFGAGRLYFVGGMVVAGLANVLVCCLPPWPWPTAAEPAAPKHARRAPGLHNGHAGDGCCT